MIVNPVFLQPNNYSFRQANKVCPVKNNVTFTGINSIKISPIKICMKKTFDRFKYLSKTRIEPICEELNPYTKFIQLKIGKNALAEAIDINPNNSEKYIVFFHGLGQNITTNQNIYKAFINKGYGVLASEYGGFGNSTGEISRKSIKQTSKAIMDYLNKKNIKNNNIGIVGFSMGSFPSLEMSTLNKETQFLVLISPFSSFKNEIGMLTKGNSIRLPKFIKYSISKFPFLLKPLDNIFKIKNKIKKIKTPLYLIHSSNDNIVPVKSIIELSKISNNLKELIIVKNGGHKVEKSKIDVFNKLKDI